MVYKILIVDDEKMMTELLSDHLRDCDYETITANDSREAIELLQKNPDLIILDINMPDMDGLELCRNIRNHVDCKFVEANYSPDDVLNVIMCHLSEENADKDNFIEQMKKVACMANVDVAEPCKEWELHNPNVAPF